jgi:hypothetical protein
MSLALALWRPREVMPGSASDLPDTTPDWSTRRARRLRGDGQLGSLRDGGGPTTEPWPRRSPSFPFRAPPIPGKLFSIPPWAPTATARSQQHHRLPGHRPIQIPIPWASRPGRTTNCGLPRGSTAARSARFPRSHRTRSPNTRFRVPPCRPGRRALRQHDLVHRHWTRLHGMHSTARTAGPHRCWRPTRPHRPDR